MKWVQVDLGGSTAIERIRLAGCDDDFNNIGAGFGFPVRYRVEIADESGERDPSDGLGERLARLGQRVNSPASRTSGAPVMKRARS